MSAKPFLTFSANDTVGLYTNEMDLVLNLVEQVARIVPVEVLDELGSAANRLEELRAWDASELEIAEAARAVDNARDLVPGFSMDVAQLLHSEATELAHALLRAVHGVEAVAL